MATSARPSRVRVYNEENVSQDAFTVIDEVSRQVTFDELMRRDPSIHTPAERLALIRLERQRRAAWQAKAEARKEKKENKE